MFIHAVSAEDREVEPFSVSVAPCKLSQLPEVEEVEVTRSRTSSTRYAKAVYTPPVDVSPVRGQASPRGSSGSTAPSPRGERPTRSKAAHGGLRNASSFKRGPARAGEHHVYKERVLVRVYDLGQTFVTKWHNKVSKGYGAFHTGVEVYGREWSFGMTFDDVSTGVMWNYPAQNRDHSFRETLSMGYTSMSPDEVDALLGEMMVEWKGNTYHVLQRNCHNFSNAVCARLGAAPLPAWVNDLAHTGAKTVDFLDTGESGYDGGKALATFFDSLKTTMLSSFALDDDPATKGRQAIEGPQIQEGRSCMGHRNPFAVLRRR